MLDTAERNFVDQGTLGNQFAASLNDYRIGEWIGLTDHSEIDTHPAQERGFILTASFSKRNGHS